MDAGTRYGGPRELYRSPFSWLPSLRLLDLVEMLSLDVDRTDRPWHSAPVRIEQGVRGGRRCSVAHASALVGLLRDASATARVRSIRA